ncbi:ABC transporter permease [Candidatus Thioglobus sp.]|jgi:ribose/xylose/arabinose/galactoside ABC-type transport system permease subunit|nr:ABC transporter permease [Candidatus Thioglobus sp.]|tara:strand:- start:128 stop:1141 length:1014 start_codon:yes stop_codon:yes gene_type:complete
MSEFFNYFSILKKFLSSSFIKAGVLPWFLGVALITFSFASDNFLTTQNILGVARHSSDLILVAMAQMVVMLTAGLDFSVGVILAMTSVVASMTMVALWSGYGSGWEAIFIGCLAGLLVGACIGLVNGLGVAFLRVPPFIMTLGMSSIIFGLALTITGGIPIYGMPESFTNIFGYGTFLGISLTIWITLFFIILVYIFINMTKMGRYFYAIGGNIRAAELSGINVRIYIVSAYVFSAVITSFAALLITARLETGEPNIGASYPLLSIAACAIGGVSLLGGVGRVQNVVLGAFFIILIQNGMNLMRVGSYLQMVVIGVLLIVAISAEYFRQQMLSTLKK